MAIRRPRRSIVVWAGSGRTNDRPVRALAASLAELGVETIYLGNVQRADHIATVVVEERADAVELCLSGCGGVLFLRDLLRELIQIGRRDVSIVVHRIETLTTDS